MRRREVIALLGGTAVAWSLAARAQQPDRGRRIGVLMGQSANNSSGQARLTGFLAGTARVELERRPQPQYRHPVGRGRCQGDSQTRDRIGRAST